MSKRRDAPADPFSTILARAIANGRGSMSPMVARQILKFGFSQADQDRMTDLMVRNNEGRLSPDEKAELLEFAHVGNFLAVLQSHARMALKRGKAKA
ncbi:MAG TPA: hypothetical protein VKD90_05000 [Gemmataceae bacterium]|nr:hypothetical protein [Gemmataceae bacterium]